MMGKFKQLGLEPDQGPVAILGAGISGTAAKLLLEKKGWRTNIFDDEKISFRKKDAHQCSFVVQSPGFSPNHHSIKAARDAGKIILSEMDVGLEFADFSELVVVTGTNGKTSLTSILSYVANRLNMPSLALGNIGVPLSQAVYQSLENGKIIFHETSSFQSVSSQFVKPDTVLWTNFSADHLDFHLCEKEYFLAKLKLANQCLAPNKVFIGKSVDDYANQISLQLNPTFQRVDPLLSTLLPPDISPFHLSFPQLENLSFAMQWFAQRGISKQEFLLALQGYSPQPHRLKKVMEFNQVSFWNDSKSTNLASVIAACKSFPEQIYWIGGGRSKGQCVNEFSKRLYPFIRQAFLIGETADQLAESFQRHGVKSLVCKTLKSAVLGAMEAAKTSANILFSPGFSSFDMFSNFHIRGNSFESIVFDLKTTCQATTNLSSQTMQASPLEL